MKICPNCGYQIPQDKVKFCYECGHKFGEKAETKPEEPKSDSFIAPFDTIDFAIDEPDENIGSLFDSSDSPEEQESSFDFSSLGKSVSRAASVSNSNYDNNGDDGVIDSGLVIKNGVLVEYKGKSKSVTIPSTVTKIADQAFYMNDYVESVVVGTNVKEIGVEAFIEFKNLRMLSLPEGLKKIGAYAFAYNERLTVISIPRSVTEIGENAFENTGISSAVIPKGVETVNDELFRICHNLKKVTIGEGVKSIGINAFELCENLTTVELPRTLKTLEHGAFSRTGISSIDLPEGLLEIGSYAFFDCINLKEIRIPKSVRIIEGDAFVGCKNLKKIYVSRSLSFKYEDSEIKAQIIYY